MSLFSFLRKNKQESASDDSAFYSRAEEDSKAVRSRARRRTGKNEQGNDPLDPVLPEKKRARRRLIGAVALVLAAVVGLPMILDSEPRPLTDDIAIQIPSKDKPAGGAIVRPNGPAVATRVAASASLDPKEEVIEPAAVEPKAAAAEDTAAKPRDDAKPAADTAKAEAKPADAQDKAARTEKTDKAEKADKAADAARAMALLDGKPDPKAADKKNQKFVVQVAALATKEKIDELQGKLKGAGIKSYTEKIATQSGDRTRIRVGPFPSKEEAEKVRARIVKLGLNGTLVPA
ncbi:MAG TPA: SPOR domain-containing protein [Noviherbaspirillum sp.]|uniref:SPOR domain-containing protein n=1 Tax=Noviherbaspirillum sp. TaxID=1926288 RepID=UPI002D36D54D|nr:SPOR domain-containing protein [Noviherbaspirillum sp.]HYD94621.1 SPOR domain-containing protein [Noviherbaspirillum sp.]